MTRLVRTFVVTIAAALAASIAVPASAQGAMRCESVDGRRQECRFFGSGTVQLSQQLSNDACIKGQSWGVDGNTIWVDRGCRADFVLASTNERSRRSRTITVVCESRDGRRHRCAADTLGQITLGRELTKKNRCDEGRTWGSDSEGIWVDGGCRAEFLIADNRGTYRDRGPSQAMRSVVCESRGASSKRSYCEAANRFGMGLTREISRNKCVLNQTWGSDRNGVWVSNGCRAEFGVKTRS
jgi:hypothetical protein